MKANHLFARILFAGVALWLLTGSASASSLQGRIADSDGSPLAGVQILLQQPESHFSKTVVTQDDGNFALDSLAPGVYVVTVRKPGYVELIQEKVLGNGGEPQQLNFRMRSNREQAIVAGAQDFNPNIFVVKLDTNEAIRQLATRGANIQIPAEFRADENYFGAPYGYPLRKVEIVRPNPLLKGFHGTLYESHQNSLFDARSFFTVGALAPWRRNDYGASASGPLWSQKTSFLAAWSQVKDAGFVNGNVQVPTREERIPHAADPATNTYLARLLQAFPNELPNLPNVSLRQLNTNAYRNVSSTAFSTRFDYRPGAADQLAVEQRFLDSTEQPFELVVGQNPVTFFRPQSIHLTEVHTFSPRTVARFSFDFDRLGVLLDMTSHYKELLEPLGVASVPEFAFGRNGDLQNLGPGSSFPRRRVENRFHFSPDFRHVSGIHTFSVGALVSRLQTNDLQSDNSRGIFNFSANLGHTAVENFLLGLPTDYKFNVGNLYRGFRNWEHAVYFQDTIRARRDWTFSLGLRYEIVTAPTEVNGLTSIPYRTDANNFAPQVGFAWNPGRGKTVVRGGYGLTFGTVFPLLYGKLRFNPPAVRVITVDNPSLLRPLEGTAVERSGLNLISPDMVVPYTHVYTLVIERELPANLNLRLGYMGNRTFKLPYEVITNRARPVPGIPTTTKTTNERRPDPRFLEISTAANGANAYYDAVQVSLDRRFSRNLAWSVQYTFSKAINSGDSTFADVGTGRHVSMDDNIVGDLKGPEQFDTPHAWTITYRYQLPGAADQSGWRSLLLGGWRVSGIYTLRSGTPYMVHTGSDAPGFGNVDGVGQDRPNLLNPAILGKSVNHPDTSQSILRREYFDPNIPYGGRGNLGFDTFRLDGTQNLNFAMEKDFRLRAAGDQLPSLQFRAEMYNFLNHPQFDTYGPHVANEIFGKITNTVNRGRIVQFTLRLRM